jgi:hypothetical protein
MVFSVNPTAEKTHQQFQSIAISSAGEGAGSPITGGGEAPPAGGNGTAPSPPVAAPSGAPTPGGGAMQPGQGMVEGGACNCAVQCMTGNFPVAGQGVGAFGGFGGGMPANMAVSG